MKSILASILLIFSVFTTFGADLTNGVFYVDTNVESFIVTHNGPLVRHNLVGGKSYMSSDTLIELFPTNATAMYFAGGPLVEAAPTAELDITGFDQEVKNLSAQPRLAEFGPQIINLNFKFGEFVVINPTNTNSSLMISTPYAAYELSGGKYFFHVTKASTIVFVMEGTLSVYSDKKNAEKVEKGTMSIAFADPAYKIITGIKSLNAEQLKHFSDPILATEKKVNNVRFVVVGGLVIGVLLK